MKPLLYAWKREQEQNPTGVENARATIRQTLAPASPGSDVTLISLKLPSDPSVEKMADLLRQKGLYDYVLEKTDTGYCLRNTKTNQCQKPKPATLYIFVTMADGTIRIGERRSCFHGFLANGAAVRYAGTVLFTETGEINEWTNGSTNYLPPLELNKQAGFDLKSFKIANDYAFTPSPGLTTEESARKNDPINIALNNHTQQDKEEKNDKFDGNTKCNRQ